MFESTTSIYLSIGLFAAIWLVGLWRSVKHAIPETKTGSAKSESPDISRKVLFHLASLISTSGPVYTFFFGFTKFGLQVWVGGVILLYGLWAYWYLKVYNYSDFVFEVGDFGSAAVKKLAGSPRIMSPPHWVFNNSVLFTFGAGLIAAGVVLSIVHLKESYLYFSGYGVIYLFFVWVYNLLDIVKVWDTHLEFRNGFSAGKPTQIPLSEITHVEISTSNLQARWGVSTVTVSTEETTLKLPMKKARAFAATLEP